MRSYIRQASLIISAIRGFASSSAGFGDAVTRRQDLQIFHVLNRCTASRNVNLVRQHVHQPRLALFAEEHPRHHRPAQVAVDEQAS